MANLGYSANLLFFLVFQRLTMLLNSHWTSSIDVSKTRINSLLSFFSMQCSPFTNTNTCNVVLSQCLSEMSFKLPLLESNLSAVSISNSWAFQIATSSDSDGTRSSHRWPLLLDPVTYSQVQAAAPVLTIKIGLLKSRVWLEASSHFGY